jgi:hypothetical protein
MREEGTEQSMMKPPLSWPIMALSPGEIAVHPSDGVPSRELWLMRDNLEKTLDELARVAIHASEIKGEKT